MNKCHMTLFHLGGVGRPPDNRMEMIKTDLKRSVSPEDQYEDSQVCPKEFCPRNTLCLL